MIAYLAVGAAAWILGTTTWILLAGLGAMGDTTVIEREATRDHTERMLRYFGGEARTERRPEGTAITVKGDAELTGRDVRVPGDPSSAAFLAAAAAIAGHFVDVRRLSS